MSINDMSMSTRPKRKPAAPPAPPVTPPVAEPPVRMVRPPPPVAAHEAEVNRFIAAYIMGIANRLANGASQHYRKRHNLGMVEWRTLMALGRSKDLIVRQVAEMADLDYAAASKSLKVLVEQGLASVEQTRTRGRAAIARLTPQGSKVYQQLQDSATQRQERLLQAFSQQEVDMLWQLLRKVESQIAAMNAQD